MVVGIMTDLIGQRFGRLVVVRRMDSDKRRNSRWLCLCDCEKEKIVLGLNLKSGSIKGCGCLRIKHGHNKNRKSSATYMSWDCMIQRCTNPNNIGYKDYGGNNITVCERWLKFPNFLEDMGERPKNTTIDRIRNELGYYKENCRWATPKEQARNRRNNHLITFNRKRQCIVDWAEETGIHVHTIQWRLDRGWSIEKALTTLVRKKQKKSELVE